MKKIYYLLMVLWVSTISMAQSFSPKNLKEIISRGNIITTTYNSDSEAGRYLGNGRFGAVISGLGLTMSPQLQKQSKMGASHFSHMKHWGRFNFISAIEKSETTADYLLPMFKLYWEKEPKSVNNYKQIHNVYDGILRTNYTLENEVKVDICNWFDFVDKDLAGIQINISEGILPINLEILSNFQAYPFVFRNNVEQSSRIKKIGDNYLVSIACKNTLNNCESDLYIYSSSPIKKNKNGIKIMISEGMNEIYISYGKPVKKEDREISLQRTKNKWHEIWKNTGWLDFPDDNAQKVWVRSMAYLLSSYDDFELGMIQPTNGLSGNPFPFHFVQDLEYISPALMMMGHNDIVMKWIEKFAGEIEQMKKYAKHLWPEAKGIYPPWELPFGSIEGYHTPNVPVAFCYEPHNVGYMARLAKEAADFSGDIKWAERYAYPLIREAALFYQAACKKEDDGLWHMAWYPCVGQDEAGGRNKTDYLCSLYSAQYTFQVAVELGLDENGHFAEILNDGLAFESLFSEMGTYHTAHGAEDDFGKQKHPVQLDGLSYFPIAPQPLLAERKAYEVRYNITSRAKEPYFFGWTLGQFLLASSNMKDTDGWRKDWSNMLPSHYIDPEWVQIRETSANAGASFYITTHGMILQSLIRNYINDYWGVLDIASCPVFNGEVSFGNIETRLGVIVSGQITKGKIELELKAKHDCSFRVNGYEIKMKNGETKKLKL